MSKFVCVCVWEGYCVRVIVCVPPSEQIRPPGDLTALLTPCQRDTLTHTHTHTLSHTHRACPWRMFCQLVSLAFVIETVAFDWFWWHSRLCQSWGTTNRGTDLLTPQDISLWNPQTLSHTQYYAHTHTHSQTHIHTNTHTHTISTRPVWINQQQPPKLRIHWLLTSE